LTKNILITQSNYIPWKGYFDAINIVDEFVLYDDMQFTRRDWRNRNKIKTADGIQWLTIPVEVKGKYFQKIKETKISDKSWNLQHWQMIRHNYNKANCFNEVKDFIENLYQTAISDWLSDVNYHFLRGISDFLEIKTPMRFSSAFSLEEGKTERLVSICKQCSATDYYTGPAAKNYMDESLFEKENITVHYFDYSGYPVYRQLFGAFTHEVSILDLLFNEGMKAKNFMKSLSNAE
jgi:hypothetical protein